MPKLSLLKQDGTNAGEITLNDTVFGIEPNEKVVVDVILSQRASLRQGTHKVKNRSEVRGGGRKPWRQKGTGRARQGSIRSRNGVAVVSYSAQHLVHMHTNYLRKFVV